jgi:hypothetical protein
VCHPPNKPNSPAISAAELKKLVLETVPTKTGLRHRCIFTFARHLKSVSALRGVDVEKLLPIVRKWHEMALPFIATKAFEETWYDFRSAWSSIKFAIGEEPIAIMYAQALAEPAPKCAEKYEQPQLRALVALCREMQRDAKSEPFYLAGRVAAQQIGVDHRTAARWLKMLCMDRVLSLAERGTRQHAAEYLYLGD